MAPEFVFSDEAQHITRSVMRELLAKASRPGVISLANGLPANECLPIEDLQACIDAVLKRDGARALQYGPPSMVLREWIASYMRDWRGVDCTPEHVFITNGSQQSLTILSRLFLNKGDVAVIEDVTFTGIAKVTKGYGATVRSVPTNLQTGIDVDALEEAFAQSPRPRLAIVISDFHNPLGVSISHEKRQRIAQLANDYHVPLVEDDPYSALRFAGEKSPAIKSYDAGGYVFYLGSFSKMLSPALRLGWMIIPPEHMARITALREAIDLESSGLTQRAVAEFLTRGLLEPHLERLNVAHQQRCALMLDALQAHLGDVASWTKPEGGLFIWVTLPEHIDAAAILPQALEHDVVYIPGGAFAVAGGYNNTMRLNFGNVPLERIEEGIERLAQLVKQQI